MTVGTGSIGHLFNINNIRDVITAKPHSAFTDLDEHGLILDLERLRSEKNYLYRQRLLETISRRANATYQGLIHGITRELGLSLYKSIWVNPRLNSNGQFLATDPYVKFDEAYVLLYSDYQNGVLDAQIDRYKTGGNFEHLWRLVDRINLSAYFEAGLHPNVDEWTRSMTILNQSNRGWVDIEQVKGSTKFRLDKYPVCKGTVFFSDRAIYQTEVTTEAAVTSKGKYYIDYHYGYVTAYLPPAPGTTVQYRYHKYPFVAWASPVILHNINADNFMVKMFEQVLQDDGTYANGIPTALGKDIINELITYHPLYWGV